MRAGADARTGDGAGILIQLPDEFFRAVIGRGAAARRRSTASPSASCRATSQARARRARAAPRRRGRGRRASGSSAGATCRSTSTRSATPAAAAAPRDRQLIVAAVARARRRPGRLRAQALRDPPCRRDRRRARPRDPELLGAQTIVYKGMLMAPQLARCFPDLRDPKHEERARAGPLALLDQHLPELGARPPLPDGRPQRRDQHGARQRQLDARARVAAGLGALRRRPRRRCCRSCARAAPTPRTSTTCSSCSCSPAARCRTR